MNAIANRIATTGTPSAQPRAAAAQQPAASTFQVDTLAPRLEMPALPKIARGDTPHVATDRDWSRLGRAAAITAGVVGGVIVASAVAQASGLGGMALGSTLMGQLYQEALPRAIGLSGLLAATEKVALAAPLLGAVAGGVVGGIASYQKQQPTPSDTPGSDLDQHSKKPVSALGLPRWTWAAVKTSLRPYGEGVHDGIDGIGSANSLGSAVASGAKAGYAFGNGIGTASGKLMGFVQGAYLGALMAGMPFSFAPLTAIPVAIVGAWGISQVMAQVGGVAGGAVCAVGGSAVGAAGYGVKKLGQALHGSGSPPAPPQNHEEGPVPTF